MVKIAGKLISLLFLLCKFFSAQNLEAQVNLKLSAVTTDGFALTKVAVGKPFVLEVTVKGVVKSQEPEIKGLDDFQVTQRTFQMRSDNGKSTMKYVLQVRADKEGSYTIGPARIENGGTVYTSNILALEVGAEEVLQDKNAKKRKATGKGSQRDKNAFFRVFADKKNVVIGEKINCALRFYFIEDEVAKINGIVTPDARDFKAIEGGVQTQGKEKIKGETYNYIECRFVLFPKKAGKLIFPACKVIYSEIIEDPMWGSFASFFGHSYRRKQLFSNALTFNVKELPKRIAKDGVEIDGNVVGNFISFDASVDRTVAREGDGIVYTLELEGAGDLEDLDIQGLQNMPSILRYYDSKRYILDARLPHGMKKKRFEFIVQGMQKGDVTIPSQTFTFFDTKTRKYKTLQTDQIKLKILSSTLVAPISSNDKSPANDVTSTSNKITQDEPEIRTIQQFGFWYGSFNVYQIPWWFFVFLLLLPLMPFGFIFTKKISSKLREIYSPHRIKKYAFKKAIKEIKFAQRKNNFAQLYPIFITFFAQRFEINESIITQNNIIQILQQKFSQEDIHKWEDFFAQISAFVFYTKEVVPKSMRDKKLFEQALVWLEMFERVFKN